MHDREDMGQAHDPNDGQTVKSAVKREFWREHLKNWKDTGSTQKDYCQFHDLSMASFHYWKRRIEELKGKRKGGLRLVPLQKATREASPGNQAVQIWCGNCRVDVGHHFDQEVLRNVLLTIRSL